MKITIGIPVYNQSEYLAEAIESALNQTVKCEVIVVNDGSTDRSFDVAVLYPVNLIDQVNKGLSSARNTIIMNMKGDYLLPLDADDVLKPNAVEKIIEKIKETDADIIAPSFECFGEGRDSVILQDGLTAKSFCKDNRIGYFSAIRKSALLEIGGYSPRMIWGYEDYHLWIDLLKRGKTISVTPDILVKYRIKKVSMITQALKHDKELREQIRRDHPEIYV